MRTRVTSALLIVLVVTVAGLAAAGSAPAQAHRGGCPDRHAANGAAHANGHSAHNAGHRPHRNCDDNQRPAPTRPPRPTATPAPTPPPTQPPTPAPEPSPTAAPTAAPTPPPSPEPTPTPEPSPSPSPTTTPTTDIAVMAVGFSPPASATPGVGFRISGNATVRNQGPAASVLADISFNLTLPADCTVSPPSPDVINDRVLPRGSNVFIGRSWTVTCTLPGPHQFGLTVSAVPDPVQGFADADASNNTLSASGSTTVN